MHPRLSANTSQLPFDIVIGRKDIVLQSLENLFENLDIVATQIDFLWNHHALFKHQVKKAFIPLELKITQSSPFNSCPSCFWWRIEGNLQIPEKVRRIIDNSKIPPTKTALLSHPPSGVRRISPFARSETSLNKYCVSQKTGPSDSGFESLPSYNSTRMLISD
jgi:hypothetical protein